MMGRKESIASSPFLFLFPLCFVYLVAKVEIDFACDSKRHTRVTV